MAQRATRKFKEAVNDLDRCLEQYSPSTAKARSLTFIALTKAFEVALEYAWKELKRRVDDSGLEANSPKDAVREAARLGYIQDPEIWIDAINARNLSVHDYFSLTEEDFVRLIRKLQKKLRDLS